MNILMTGGTGLIGSHLVQSFVRDGHQVWVLTRNPHRARLPGEARVVAWDGRSTRGWEDLVHQTDVVINLAGESLARWPWTKKQKARFWLSRVEPGLVLAEAIRAASPRPRVFVQVSGINHYGLDGEIADENSPPGSDYLAQLTVAWEDATSPVENLRVRRVVVRLAIVLARKGGLLGLMTLPVRLFAGGPLGSGVQAVPWIHVDDVVGAIRFLVDDQSASGAYNLIAPERTSNAEFYRLLARVLKRPYWLRTPAFLLKAVLGELSVLVLEGRYVAPGRLLETGYRFKFEMAEAALRDALKRRS
ncbi:MAG: TIGR01777 family oxidoreductase [Anaerolineales bacterium]|nr:TIGR01777 family oxidoreductase [Anaerolineales bacterium]